MIVLVLLVWASSRTGRSTYGHGVTIIVKYIVLSKSRMLCYYYVLLQL